MIQLASDAPEISLSDPALAVLVDELTDRLLAGEAVDLEDFIGRHSEHAAQLRQLVPALEMIGELKRSAASEGASSWSSGRDPRLEAGVLGDFRIVREIGRGGMGVVYEAQQLSLDRRVALKVVPMAAAMDSKQLQRFQLEAHAAACLHHTNIVPVHAVGCERGVPFYAMQFIEGRSLAQLIAELRRLERLDAAEKRSADLADLSTSTLAANLLSGQRAEIRTRLVGRDATATEGRKPDLPGSPAAASHPKPDTTAHRRSSEPSPCGSTRSREYIRTVAQLGVQVADALDHAHTRGILHRDIKPANLLLDDNGQLWVTDFGLAQIQGNPGLSLTGDILGTLRYMSPEQALAKRVVIDGRTDIYSLAVTLYELLTLRPAVDGRDRAEVLRKIAEEEPTPPRRLNLAVPRDLETVLLKAIAKEPAARYATAKELADELGRFLEHRPVVARRPSPFDRVVKWMRRHRSAVSTGVVGLLAAVAILAGSIGWIVRDRAARLVMTENEVSRALHEAITLQGQSKWPEALEAAKRAEGLLAVGASESLRQRVREVERDMKMVLHLEEIWLPHDGHGNEGPNDYQWVDASYAQAFREYGIDVEALEPAEAARRIRARSIRLELAVALDCWADRRQALLTRGSIWDAWPDQPDHSRAPSPTSWNRLIAVARAADPHEWRDQVRAALEQQDRKSLSELTASPGFSDLPAQLLSVVCRHVDNEHTTAALRRAQLEHPDNFLINGQLAWVFRGNDSTRDDAIRFYTAALALRPTRVPTRCFLGSELYSVGKVEEAIAHYRKALELKPDSPRALNNLAWFLATSPITKFRNSTEAVQLASKAIALNPRYGEGWNTLGAALFRAGHPQAAIEALEHAGTLRGDHACDWLFLAMAHGQLGNKPQALRWLDKADQWMRNHSPTDEELVRIRAEAEELLRIKDQSQSETKNGSR